MQEVSDRYQLKLDHVLSVPVDLREMKAAQIPNPSIHRTEELMNLHTTELDESNSRISVSVEESKEESDEANTSELAQDVELLYELMDEKDAEAKQLKREFKELQESYDEVQNVLEEAQMIIAEQQEQLAVYRQEVAVSKSNIEALKIRNFILASNGQGATDEIRKMMEEYQEMHEELERLRQNQNSSEVEMLRLRKQGSFSSKNADHDQGNGNISERGEKRRENARGLKENQFENVSTGIKIKESSEETEELIDRLRSEKQHWQEYANRLVLTIVECGLSPEELLEASEERSSSRASSENSERWRTYALRLLNEVVNSDPSKLTDFDRKLLRRHSEELVKLSIGNTSNVGENRALQTTSSAGCERQTRANFAQTRRRKIDKLKDFFKGRKVH
ncbi:unnamed protein product [Hymenolepis diminuta]|nr:unnamed protein product [Hymenolepis diminuta]